MLKREAVQRKAAFFGGSRKCEKLLDMFSFFANEHRFKILCSLNEQDFCVNDLVDITGGKPSNISQQLKILTLAGYLEKRREGKLIIYHLKDKKIKNLLAYLYELYGEGTGHRKTKGERDGNIKPEARALSGGNVRRPCNI